MDKGVEDLEDLCTIYDGKLTRVKAVRSKSGFFAVKCAPVAQGLSLQREWAILQQLSLSDAHSDDSAPFIRGWDYWLSLDGERANLLLDLAEGGPLHRHIRAHGQLPVERARMYSFELADALLVLRERHRCIHRDLKASNVLLDARGHIKICDFGAAKMLSSSQERAFTITGTLHAMAPEMVSRDLGYDYSVDWWALGVLIYEMLTGRPPAFTWHCRGRRMSNTHHTHHIDASASVASNGEIGDATGGRVLDRLVSEEQSQKARRKVTKEGGGAEEKEETDSDWDFAEVNELLSFYPYPPMPKGDILNNIAVIERRLAHEAVQLAEQFICELLSVQPKHRRIPTRADLENNEIPWLHRPKENESIEYDRRWGVAELLRSSSSEPIMTESKTHTEGDSVGETDPFLGF